MLLQQRGAQTNTCWNEDCQYDRTGCLRPHIELCQFHIIGHLWQTMLVMHQLRHMRECFFWGKGRWSKLGGQHAHQAILIC